MDKKKEDLSGCCIIELMEYIACLSSNKGAPKKALQLPEVAQYAEELANRLTIAPIQAFLLALFVNFYPDSDIETRQLAHHLRCTNLAVMACYEDIKLLQSKHYLSEHKSRDSIEYLIPMNAISAFRENHDIIPTDYSNLTSDYFFEEINNVFRAHMDNSIDYEELYDTLTAIVGSNPQLSFCRQLNDYRLNKEDTRPRTSTARKTSLPWQRA